MRNNTKSIIQDDNSKCFLCGRNGNGDPLEKHHCLHGIAYRKMSEEDGLYVWLCGIRCHREGPESAHKNHDVDMYLKCMAEKAWENTYGDSDDFINRYGRRFVND